MRILKSFNSFNETKSDKWIQDAIKKPGSLRKELKKEDDESITKSEIDEEIKKLKKKDKEPHKKGIQGLSKKDLKTYRRLNLAKTLKSMKESSETDNYMFFQNLNTMKEQIEEMLTWSESEVDDVLNDGHDWAVDHVCSSKEYLSQVYEFLAHRVNR